MADETPRRVRYLRAGGSGIGLGGPILLAWVAHRPLLHPLNRDLDVQEATETRAQPITNHGRRHGAAANGATPRSAAGSRRLNPTTSPAALTTRRGPRASTECEEVVAECGEPPPRINQHARCRGEHGTAWYTHAYTRRRIQCDPLPPRFIKIQLESAKAGINHKAAKPSLKPTRQDKGDGGGGGGGG